MQYFVTRRQLVFARKQSPCSRQGHVLCDGGRSDGRRLRVGADSGTDQQHDVGDYMHVELEGICRRKARVTTTIARETTAVSGTAWQPD